ncbi:MAG: hypothetical protein AVO33_08245 [delta proteobacterium ML8_F1]|nr:MAG: hypothetical protein AVO33_08245 [delta proteobacterium ML8_F1]
MDSILMKAMEFYAYHGVMPEEKILGQLFRISLVLELDLGPAGRSDRVEDTVSYAEVYDEVKELVEGESFDLVEKLAYEIGAKVLRNHPRIQGIEVVVEKPQAPVKGHFNHFGVKVCLRPSDI